jgi:O-antigen/teichoic acid export membrane protein
VSDPNTKSRVYRNTIQLVFSQVVSVPVSIALNAFLARYLGAADFGQIYLATTFASLAFLLVDWGQISTLPARVVTDLQRAGDYLGTAVLWRLLGAVVVALVLLGGTYLLGYSSGFQAVLAIVLVSALLTSLISACQSVIIGFERTDIAAITQALHQGTVFE